jgi:hypothetical protein
LIVCSRRFIDLSFFCRFQNGDSTLSSGQPIYRN